MKKEGIAASEAKATTRSKRLQDIIGLNNLIVGATVLGLDPVLLDDVASEDCLVTKAQLNLLNMEEVRAGEVDSSTNKRFYAQDVSASVVLRDEALLEEQVLLQINNVIPFSSEIVEGASLENTQKVFDCSSEALDIGNEGDRKGLKEAIHMFDGRFVSPETDPAGATEGLSIPIMVLYLVSTVVAHNVGPLEGDLVKRVAPSITSLHPGTVAGHIAAQTISTVTGAERDNRLDGLSVGALLGVQLAGKKYENQDAREKKTAGTIAQPEKATLQLQFGGQIVESNEGAGLALVPMPVGRPTSIL